MSSSYNQLIFKYNQLLFLIQNQSGTSALLNGDNTFTGTNQFDQIPTTATATVGDNSSKVATTEFVNTAISNIDDILTTDNTFTGTNQFDQIPTTATATAGDNSSKVATTEFVNTAISNIDDILTTDNTFTGTNQFDQIPTTATATAGDNSSKVATTEYVDTAISVIPDLLSTDNTFTGTNDFTEQVSFTLPPHSAPPLLGNDLATKGYVDSLVGQYSGGLNLFLNYSQPVTVGGNDYYSLSKTVSSAPQQSLIIPTVNGEHLLISFITDELNILEIPTGLWNLLLYGAVSGIANIIYYHFHLKKYSGGVISTISLSGNSLDVNATPSNNPDIYHMNATVSTAEPMLLTDRIIIEVYYTKNTGSSVNLTTYFENAYYSFVQSTLNAGTTLLTSDNNWTANNNFELSPIVPTVTAGDASTKVASTEYVDTAINNIVYPFVGTATSNLNMNGFNITSASALTIGQIERNTNLVGRVYIPNDLIVGEPAEEVRIYGGRGGDAFDTTTQNDIQIWLGTRVRNALYVAFILPTTTGPSIMTLPSALNSYSVKVVNNCPYPWTIRGQIGQAIIQGQGGFGTLNPNSVTINPFQTITFLQVNNISGQVNILDSQMITGTTSNFTALQCAFYDTGNSAISINVGTSSSGATNLGRLTQATDIRGQLKMNGSSGSYGQCITSRGETASPVWDTPYVTFNGSVRGDMFFPDRIISMSSLATADNLINGSSLSITGYTGRLIESKVSSFVGTRTFPGNNYFTKMQASSSKGGVITSFFDSVASSTTDFKFEIDGTLPTIRAIIGATYVPITIKSPLNMDGNTITNLLSLDSSSTLSLTSTGDMTIGNLDINTNLEGVVNVKNDLIVGSGASTVRLFGGDSGDTFDTTTQNDIQLRLAGESRNQIYNAVILNTTTGVGTIILPSILNGYYVYIINNSPSDWTIKPQVGEFMRQGLAGGGVGNPSAGIIVRAFQTFGFFQLDSGTEKYSLIVSEVINGTSPTFSTILCNAYEGKSNTTINFATFFASAVNISKTNINTSIYGRIRLGTNAGIAGQVITSAGASIDTIWSTPYISPAGLAVPTTTLNMNQNSITNVPSIDSSTTLTLAGTTALGINVGRAGQTTDVKGNFQINSSSGTAGQVLTSTGPTTAPTWQSGGGGGSVSTYSFRKPTTVQSIPHNSSTTVFFDTVTVNTTSLGYSAGVFTNTSGTTLNVMVSYNIGFSPNASGIRKIALNSSILGSMSGCELASTTSVPMILTATSLVQLAHNATFIITAFQNSGFANNLTTPTNIQIIVL